MGEKEGGDGDELSEKNTVVVAHQVVLVSEEVAWVVVEVAVAEGAALVLVRDAAATALAAKVAGA